MWRSLGVRLMVSFAVARFAARKPVTRRSCEASARKKSKPRQAPSSGWPKFAGVKPETRSSYTDIVQRVVDRVLADLDGALDLEALAREACLSPFHFHRIFRGMVGETPIELVRRVRMERAAWRLLHTDAPVTSIAFGAGFETHEAFTRAFRAQYAQSPSRFRPMKGARIHLAASNGVHYEPGQGSTAFVPRDSGGRAMQVEIVQKPALRVASIRHVGPYMQIHHAFQKLEQITKRTGLLEQGSAMVAIYHDDPDSTPPDQLRSDAGIVVPEGASLPSQLTEQRLPAGSYACTIHVGPYERLGDTWQRLMGEWIPSHGKRVHGLSYERYLNMPGSVPKDELRTEICVPVT
jgi:AraC family transcriptional regulator